MDKKLYLEPEMEILNMNIEGFFCASLDIPDNDGEVGGTDVDTSKPGWDADF